MSLNIEKENELASSHPGVHLPNAMWKPGTQSGSLLWAQLLGPSLLSLVTAFGVSWDQEPDLGIEPSPSSLES